MSTSLAHPCPAEPAAVQPAAAARADTLDVFLSTIAVVALAVSQPLLDLLGRTPTFFVARGAPTLDVILTGLVLGLAVPLWTGALVTVTWRINRRLGSWLHAAVLCVSVALLTLTVLKVLAVPDFPGWALLGVGLLVGVGAVVSWRRWTPVRSLLRYAGAAPLVVTAWFLMMSPAASLVWDSPEPPPPVAADTATTPVVMVVFDEFPVATLIDGSGDLRGDLFPGFARLASRSTWFRNAVGTQERTELALPTMLSGVPAMPGGKVPDAGDYPDTLFTLLGDGHEVHAIESVTALCPATVCPEGSRIRTPAVDRWRSLATDLMIVAGHVLVPEDLIRALPPIDTGWRNFASADDAWGLNQRFNQEVAADRRRSVDRFLAGLDHPLAGDELHFAHMLLPHSPWMYLPSGERHGAAVWPTAGAEGVWIGDAWRVEQAYQRHLLQVQYVDSIIGALVDTLERNGSYNDALVLVAADHGIAMQPRVAFRAITPESVGGVAAVPLFVKLPGQHEGRISDYRAETPDILPTIAAALGVDIPWDVSGTDLFAAELPERTESAMLGKSGEVAFGASGGEKREVARYHAEWFDGGGPYDLVPPGQRDLLGTEAARWPVAQANGIGAHLEQDDPLEEIDGDTVAAHLAGTLSDAPPRDHVLAIAIDGEIVAVTRTWRDGGEIRFMAMLPPAALASGSAPTIYLVERTGVAVSLASLSH